MPWTLFRLLEKQGTITEDELRRAQDDIQKLTDKYVAEIDDMLGRKGSRDHAGVGFVCSPDL